MSYSCETSSPKHPVAGPKQLETLVAPKTGGLHYNYHSGQIKISPNYAPSTLNSTSTSVLSTAFLSRLGEFCLANLENLGPFHVAIETSDISVTTRLYLLSEHLKLHLNF